jgi:cytochrome c biogenesis protein ResB
MELSMTADRLLKAAEQVRVVTHAQPRKGDDSRRPALRVRMEGALSAPSDWVVWGDEPRVVESPGGAVTLAYGAAEAPIPFRVTLLDFRSQRYPGSDRPATYESLVAVDDPAQGRSEHLIAMNRPLHYGGYTFFQSSYVEGERMTSILSVSRSPGLPVVYLGTVLISIGVVWMFYLKPMLARRQARRALQARGGRLGATATA